MNPFISTGIVWLVAAAGAGAASALECVRVFHTEPAVFEYRFTGAFRAPDGTLLLAFNHRSGETSFVRPGDNLGRYRVTEHTAATRRVFHPSLNAALDEPADRVVLSGGGHEAIALDLDKPLAWSGRTAWLVRLDSGAWWSVEEMDVFYADNQPVAVEEIDDRTVTVSAAAGLVMLAPISDPEKAALERLWADRRQAQEERARAEQLRREEAARAAAAAEPARPAARPPRAARVEIREPRRFFYGSEIRFPTAFKVSPGIRSADGRILQMPFVVPSRFESRSAGIAIEVR